MNWLLYPLAMFALLATGLLVWRQLDERADRVAWQALAATPENDPAVFDWSLIADLPEPVRRYFTFTILPGALIRTAVRIEMTGKLGLGTQDSPKYQLMQAEQILAPPYGLVWKLKSGLVSGSDGAMTDSSWTRFWLFNMVPVVRASGPDHQRSAFGRVVAEAAFWAPASLLPGDNVSWTLVDDNTARATVRYGQYIQAVDITVDSSGAPIKVVVQRWSNENPDKIFREQPFGGFLSEFREFDGYRLPTHVEGGNHFGTADYFPFYIVDVSAIYMH